MGLSRTVQNNLTRHTYWNGARRKKQKLNTLLANAVQIRFDRIPMATAKGHKLKQLERFWVLLPTKSFLANPKVISSTVSSLSFLVNGFTPPSNYSWIRSRTYALRSRGQSPIPIVSLLPICGQAILILFNAISQQHSRCLVRMWKLLCSSYR